MQDIVSHGDSASAETATSKAAARLESLDRQQLTQGPNSCLAAKISDSDVDCADLPVPETETNSLIQHDSEQSQGHKPADAGFVSPADPAGKPARPRGEQGTADSHIMGMTGFPYCNTWLVFSSLGSAWTIATGGDLTHQQGAVSNVCSYDLQVVHSCVGLCLLGQHGNMLLHSIAGLEHWLSGCACRIQAWQEGHTKVATCVQGKQQSICSTCNSSCRNHDLIVCSTN